MKLKLVEFEFAEGWRVVFCNERVYVDRYQKGGQKWITVLNVSNPWTSKGADTGRIPGRHWKPRITDAAALLSQAQDPGQRQRLKQWVKEQRAKVHK